MYRFAGSGCLAQSCEFRGQVPEFQVRRWGFGRTAEPGRIREPAQQLGSLERGTIPMVFLSRIYTKSGDNGETGLGDGSRVPKDAPRVAAYGEVDELNAVIGLVVANCPDCPEAALLRSVQNDLFDVGADLCVPPTGVEEAKALRVVPAQ